MQTHTHTHTYTHRPHTHTHTYTHTYAHTHTLHTHTFSHIHERPVDKFASNACVIILKCNEHSTAFVSNTYPERTAFELLKQIRKEFMDKEEARTL